jgi:hypothetical protein
MYVEGVGQKSGPCTATFNDLLCFPYRHAINGGVWISNSVCNNSIDIDFIELKISLLIILRPVKYDKIFFFLKLNVFILKIYNESMIFSVNPSGITAL